MKTKIFMMTALALTLMVGNAGCNEKGGSDKVPAGMHEVTYQGFAFLCPDVLKPAKQLGSDETAPNFFMLDETDMMNSLSCEVSETNAEFTREAGERFGKEMTSGDPKTKVEYKVLENGILVKTVLNDPSLSSETIYTSMRIFVKEKKAISVTFAYSENNKATLSKFVDAVMDSVKAIE